jgi:benzoyl-CoA reductase/2-hydroxyglutaryl-CoA dehydratase subunit BcrC/BadD/HgdB
MSRRDNSAPGAANDPPRPAPDGADGPVTPQPAEAGSPLEYFDRMIDNCYDYAEAAKRAGRPIVGIMCEFTPRELILAAGGVPVCLCGGSAATVAAAEQFLPSNLCPLIKSTFGYHVTGRNPFLNWADLIVAETTCDGKKKMFELLGERKPMYVLELPQKAEDADAFERWVSELRKFRTDLERRFNVEISDTRLREAAVLMNRERKLRRELADLMVVGQPPLTGRQLLDLKSIISGIEADLEQYARILEWARRRKPCGTAASPGKTDGRPRGPSPTARVLLTGVPLVHGAERVVEIIENGGATVVCMENCTGLKPVLEDVDLAEPDVIRAIARKYYHLPCSVMTPNRGRFDTLRALAAKFRPDCVIELVWQACLTYDIESFQVRKVVEDELSLPFLKITTDYSPADSARIQARVEALVETARARRG